MNILVHLNDIASRVPHIHTTDREQSADSQFRSSVFKKHTRTASEAQTRSLV